MVHDHWIFESQLLVISGFSSKSLSRHNIPIHVNTIFTRFLPFYGILQNFYGILLKFRKNPVKSHRNGKNQIKNDGVNYQGVVMYRLFLKILH